MTQATATQPSTIPPLKANSTVYENLRLAQSQALKTGEAITFGFEGTEFTVMATSDLHAMAHDFWARRPAA